MSDPRNKIIFVKEIEDYALYLVGPKAIDELVENSSVMDLMTLRDSIKDVVREFDQMINEASLGLDPYYY